MHLATEPAECAAQRSRGDDSSSPAHVKSKVPIVRTDKMVAPMVFDGALIREMFVA
jgi:hypothetical protein